MAFENFLNEKSKYFFVITKTPGREIFLKESWLLNNSESWCSFSDAKNICSLENTFDVFTETDMEGNPVFGVIALDKDCDIKGFKKIPLREFIADNEEVSVYASRARGLMEFRANYKFCPKCGTALIEKNFSGRFCPGCSDMIFPRISPAIITLVSKGDEVLLVKHKNRNQNMWACIAGFVESGETIEQTIVREVKEEVGINVKDVRYVGSQSWPFPDQLMFAFRAEYDSGNIKIQEDEISQAAWFKREEIPVDCKPPKGSVAYRLINGEFEDCCNIQ